MIKKEDMKEGLLIWWTTSNGCEQSSHPSIVTIVREGFFSVKSFEDFKETNPFRIDDIFNSNESVRNRNDEINICTLKRIQYYFKDVTRNFEDDITKKTRDIQDLEDELKYTKNKLAEYQKNIELFLDTQS